MNQALSTSSALPEPISGERTSEVYLIDCMEGMKNTPDNYYDLAVVDPPYGDDDIFGGRPSGKMYKNGSQWNNKPTNEYFNELRRVSKNQIVWGGNYFSQLWPCKSFIIWDKRQPEGISFAMVELAATSFNGVAKLFFTKPAGERGFYTVDCKRIHPTQKPIKLYQWIYNTYLPEGGKVIDTHLGSGSNRIAAHKAGNIDFTGYEIDRDYYEAQEARWKAYISQTRLF